MRVLSAEALALEAAGVEPQARVWVEDMVTGLPRLKFSWAGTGHWVSEGGPVALASKLNGHGLEVWLVPSSGELWCVDLERLQGLQWANPLRIATGALGSGPVCLAGAAGVVRVFFVSADGRSVMCALSSDDGTTWGAASAVCTLLAGHHVGSLGCWYYAAGDTWYLVYSDEVTGATSGVFYVRTKTGAGAWSAAASWGRAAFSASYGVCVWGNDEDLHIYAAVNGGIRHWDVPRAAPTPWGEPKDVMRADSSTVSLRWPMVSMEVAGGLLAWVEYHQGDGLGHRLLTCGVLIDWHDAFGVRALPWYRDAGTEYGVALGVVGGDWLLLSALYWWAFEPWDPQETWRRRDVSADVLAVEASEEALAAGRLVVTLRNDRQQWGHPWDLPGRPLWIGGQVRVAFGFRLASGLVEWSERRPYRLDRLRWQVRDGRWVLQLVCVDGWGELDTTRAVRPYVWRDSTVGEVLLQILRGFGWFGMSDGAAQWDQSLSRFDVQPGQLWGDVVRALLGRVWGWVRWTVGGEGPFERPVAYIGRGESYDTTVTYQVGEADLRAGEMDFALTPFSDVLAVNGEGAAAWVCDWDSTEWYGLAQPVVLVDKRAADGAALAELATQALYGAMAERWTGRIVGRPHIGQEVGDWIEVRQAGEVICWPLQVRALRVRWDVQKGLWEQRAELGGIVWNPLGGHAPA